MLARFHRTHRAVQALASLKKKDQSVADHSVATVEGAQDQRHPYLAVLAVHPDSVS